MNSTSKPLIAIMGTPVTTGNRGVMALGASLVSLCLKTRPEAKISYLVGNLDNRSVNLKIGGQELTIPVVNYRMSPKSSFRDHLGIILFLSLVYRLVPVSTLRMIIARSIPWIGAVVEAEIVGDIRGGDSFSDIYGFRRFLMGFLPVWSVLLVKKSITLFPQTYGPYKSRLAKILAGHIMRRASTLVARDRESQQLAQKMVGPGKEVDLSPDVAFILEPELPDRLVTTPPLERAALNRCIGINVNGLMYYGGYTRKDMFGLKMDYPAFLEKLVHELLKVAPDGMLFIPHTYASPGSVQSDNEAGRCLITKLAEQDRKRIYLLDAEYDQHQIKGIIGQCDFFIGSRMHSCIAALSQGIPCVGVAYSKKFAGVFDTVGMNEWVVDGRQYNDSEAIRQILDLYQRRDTIREMLLTNVTQARNRLVEIFKKILL